MCMCIFFVFYLCLCVCVGVCLCVFLIWLTLPGVPLTLNNQNKKVNSNKNDHQSIQSYNTDNIRCDFSAGPSNYFVPPKSHIQHSIFDAQYTTSSSQPVEATAAAGG